MVAVRYRSYFYFTLISLCFSSICSLGQEVLGPKYPDPLHFKIGNHQIKEVPLSPQNIFIPTWFFDTTLNAVSKIQINYYKQYLSKAPIKLDDCVYFNPGNSDLINKIIHPLKKEIIPKKPFSFILYSDTLNYFDIADDKSEYCSYLKLTKPIEDYYAPFYFKETEVTNKEYKEFVNWVLDSIVRCALGEDGKDEFFLPIDTNGNRFLNKKQKILWDDKKTKEVLEFLYLPPEEKYYRRLEFDSRRINYIYLNDKNEKCFINVYPDTLAWVHNFPSQVNFEPMTNMYFWHIAFENYPVVGITQLQAQAFLIWKTEQKQKLLDEEHSNYIIKYELPNEMEWEMVATANNNNNPIVYSPDLTRLYDENYFTDLSLFPDTSGYYVKSLDKGDCEGCKYDIVIYYPKLYSDALKKKPLANSTISFDKYTPPNLYSTKKNYPRTVVKNLSDINGIYFMGGNVSEWMLDTYKENWHSVYTYHESKLKKIKAKDAQMLVATENYYNSMNDTNGVLIRGGNWYDYNDAISSEKNFEGMNKKIFVDPEKAFATVGFRYVVKVYRKDEEEIIKKMSAANKCK